jgi:hypothetical protein
VAELAEWLVQNEGTAASLVSQKKLFLTHSSGEEAVEKEAYRGMILVNNSNHASYFASPLHTNAFYFTSTANLSLFFTCNSPFCMSTFFNIHSVTKKVIFNKLLLFLLKKDKLSSACELMLTSHIMQLTAANSSSALSVDWSVLDRSHMRVVCLSSLLLARIACNEIMLVKSDPALSLVPQAPPPPKPTAQRPATGTKKSKASSNENITEQDSVLLEISNKLKQNSMHIFNRF